MNRVRTIEQELSSIDEQLAGLYRKKDELNGELKLLQEQKLHQEIDRWHLRVGNCYWLFAKDNDSIYSTLYGYQITKIQEGEFFTAIQTKYGIESGEPHLDVHEVLISAHCLRTNREENNVYIVSTDRYKELQIKLLSLDTDSAELMQAVEEDIVKPNALYVVE